LAYRCPEHVPVERWQKALADGQRFLARWGEQSEALGWSGRVSLTRRSEVRLRKRENPVIKRDDRLVGVAAVRIDEIPIGQRLGGEPDVVGQDFVVRVAEMVERVDDRIRVGAKRGIRHEVVDRRIFAGDGDGRIIINVCLAQHQPASSEVDTSGAALAQKARRL
jgi:hypothetical protein